MYKKVLIPIDGSEGSNLALDYCLRMLDSVKPEKIVLFNVVSYPTQLETYSGKMRSVMKQAKEDWTEYGDEILAKAKDKIMAKGAGVPLETKMVWGHPKLEIVQEADGGKYDLLIIGSRGLSGIKSFLLGSVGSYVAQHVKCTVVLVKE